MNVYKLTEQQAQQIIDKNIDPNTIIYPTKDNDGVYYITQELYENLSIEKIQEWGVENWWFTLPLIPYNPLISNSPI